MIEALQSTLEALDVQKKRADLAEAKLAIAIKILQVYAYNYAARPTEQDAHQTLQHIEAMK